MCALIVREDRNLFSVVHDGAMVSLHGLCSWQHEDAATCRLEIMSPLTSASSQTEQTYVLPLQNERMAWVFRPIDACRG